MATNGRNTTDTPSERQMQDPLGDGETVWADDPDSEGGVYCDGNLDDMLANIGGIDPIMKTVENMTDLQKRIIYVAAKDPSLSQTEIAEEVNTSQPTVSDTLNNYEDVYEVAQDEFTMSLLEPDNELVSIRVQADRATAEKLRDFIRVLDADTLNLHMEEEAGEDVSDNIPGKTRFLDYIREYSNAFGRQPTLKELRECPADLPVADPSAALTVLCNYEEQLDRRKNEDGKYVYMVNTAGKQELSKYDML